MSKIPDSIMWSNNETVLTKEEGLRMDCLRLAMAFAVERGLTPGSLDTAAKAFYRYVTTGE